jgi:hypothetical protein
MAGNHGLTVVALRVTPLVGVALARGDDDGQAADSEVDGLPCVEELIRGGVSTRLVADVCTPKKDPRRFCCGCAVQALHERHVWSLRVLRKGGGCPSRNGDMLPGRGAGFSTTTGVPSVLDMLKVSAGLRAAMLHLYSHG